jgi:hypothetical protein
MRARVYWPPSPALVKRLDDIQAAAGPNSRSTNRVKGDIRQIVISDNTEKLLGRGNLEGVDRHGRPLAPMAPSTYQNPRRGLGPVLAPRGLLSRAITAFRATWQGGLLVMGWVGIPWIAYHLTGCPKGSNARRPNWSLPQRDIAGTTPQGFARIKARHSQYAQDVLKGER